ncbi:hypothetical protein BH23ACT5_BH23ACT5_08580 [soil metagenome]
MSSGSVPGVDSQLTPLGLDDVDALHDLIRRWEVHWEIPLVTPRSEVEEEFGAPGFLPELDTRGVWIRDRLAAAGTVSHTPSGVRLERAHVFGRVDPQARGNGLGRRLFAWQVERAAECLRVCNPGIPWYVRTHEWEWIEDAHRLHRRFGFEPVRWFEDLVRPLDDLPPLAVPDGIEVVGWKEASADGLRQASNASFADHWGSTPRDAESWRHSVESSGTRLDLSFAALSPWGGCRALPERPFRRRHGSDRAGGRVDRSPGSSA